MNSDSYPADGFSNLFNSLSTDGNVGPLITYMLLALIVSSICSVLEATILSTPITFINTLEQQGAKGAARLKKLKTDIDRPISAILIVNTIANTVGASLVGAEAAKLFQSTGVGVISGLFTFLILVFSEIIPKTIGSNYWRNLAVPASAVIQGMIYITYPIVWLGVLEKEENKMIQNLLKLDDVTAHEIMTPSSVVTMAESSQTIREFYNSDDFAKFSRIPLYEEENDDYITGYVLKQEILEKLAQDKFNIKLKDLARPILSFNEDESVSNIWEKLLEKKEHISVIIDEYGSMRGIVTMEDVIETMLGFEIVDEKDEVVDMQELAKEQWQQVQNRQMARAKRLNAKKPESKLKSERKD